MRSTTQRWGLARLITASPARACTTILATMPRTFSIPTAIASRRSTRGGSTLRHNTFEFQGGGDSRSFPSPSRQRRQGVPAFDEDHAGLASLRRLGYENTKLSTSEIDQWLSHYRPQSSLAFHYHP